MNFRTSTKHDISKIMIMINQAKEYLKENNVDQWQNGYPNEELIERDIENEISYVLEIDNNLIASAVVTFEPEPSYNEIYNGKWLSEQAYVVVHRIVVDNSCKGKGISAEIMRNVEEMCKKRNIQSIKIDTHNDNLSMQNFLKKNGFTYCGDIKLEDGSPRIAFEKLV